MGIFSIGLNTGIVNLIEFFEAMLKKIDNTVDVGHTDLVPSL